MNVHACPPYLVFLAPASWGGGGSHGDPAVDNGTAAWGKASDGPAGWGDPEDSAKGWGNPSSSAGKSGKDAARLARGAACALLNLCG